MYDKMEPNKQPWSADNNGHEAAEDAVQVMSNTTTPAKNGSNSSTKPDKKVKYKSLWGKVGKHGLAEAAKEKAAADSSSSSSTGRLLFQPIFELISVITFGFK